MLLWRLVPEARKDAAFSGQGSREYGGRWNPRGAAVVYLAEHLSLAALESYVHLPRAALAMPYLAYRVTLPDDLRLRVVLNDELPPNWRDSPVPLDTQELGLRWLENGDSLLLSVPSAIIPQERNLVLNLDHADWQLASISAPEPFFFDSRMWQKP